MTEPQENKQNQPQGGREPAILLPGVITALLGLMLAVHIARVVTLNESGDLNLMTWLAFWPLRFTQSEYTLGGWLPLLWTPFTHVFLHADWTHLIMNGAWLAIFGTPVARRYGVWRTLLLFFLSAAVGAGLFAITVLPDNQVLIGASGGIAGLTGAACRFVFQPVIVERDPISGTIRPLGRRTASLMDLAREGRARYFILFWLIFNAAVPLLPNLFGAAGMISWQAHLGGFLTGLLILPLIEPRAPAGKADSA